MVVKSNSRHRRPTNNKQKLREIRNCWYYRLCSKKGTLWYTAPVNTVRSVLRQSGRCTGIKL